MAENLVASPEDKELLSEVKAVIKAAQRGPVRQYEIRTYEGGGTTILMQISSGFS